MDHIDTTRETTAAAPELVLHAEKVAVSKERVATGSVTLRKKVVTEEVSVPVTLRRDELDVVEETFDAGHLPAGAQVRDLGDGDVEITLYAERPVVTVEVVPVERVRLTKGVITETRTFDVELGHEEAVVVRDDAADLARDRR